MESTATMVELGGDQWSSFDGVSVNEEADFMAQLFPNPSLTNQLEISSSTSFLALSSSSFYDTNTSFYSSDDTNDSNLYSNFSQDSSTNYSGNNVYPCHENYYMNNPNQFLAANPTSLPIDFFLTGANPANLEQSVGDLTHHGVPIPDMNLQLKPEYDISETDHAADDKNSDSSDNPRKRSRVSDNKGKRKVRSKKNQGIGSDEEDDDPNPNRHNSSSCSSEEDNINGCQEMRLKESAPHNSNAKTRASRGSATDPQSLYARKRRERINERLKILQSLVPNGTKVDISTMLEEAVHYVNFLQLQIKLLSSDEMWMYAPLAYNGMDIGLDALNTMINRTR